MPLVLHRYQSRNYRICQVFGARLPTNCIEPNMLALYDR